jgi:kinase-associated protein B
MENKLEEGQIVTGLYKTGKYTGEIIAVNEARSTAVVKVLAVNKHPVQGDLHNPGTTNVPLFHERKALSFNEKTNIPLSYIKPHTGTVPEYVSSLKTAVENQKKELEEDGSAWAKKALQTLEEVEKDYY